MTFPEKKEEGKHQLKIATIFSYGTNEESKDADGIYDELEFGMVAEPQAQYGDSHSRNILESYIGHYNEMFGTNFFNKGFSDFLQLL